MTCSRIANLLLKILVPLVEKVAEHLTAVDEAHDNQVPGPDDSLRIMVPY